jgi:hypothetical protein
MAQLELRARGAEQPGDVPIAVVTHHSTDGDAPGGKPRQRAPQKRGTRRGELVGQHLNISDATVVIDRDVHVLPGRFQFFSTLRSGAANWFASERREDIAAGDRRLHLRFPTAAFAASRRSC